MCCRIGKLSALILLALGACGPSRMPAPASSTPALVRFKSTSPETAITATHTDPTSHRPISQQCTAPCELAIPLARVRIKARSDGNRASESIDITAPRQAVDVDPGNEIIYVLGFAMVAVSGGVLIIGTGLPELTREEAFEDSSGVFDQPKKRQRDTWFVVPSVAGILGGLILMDIGSGSVTVRPFTTPVGGSHALR